MDMFRSLRFRLPAFFLAGAVLAGLPKSVGGITVNRFCASGLAAVQMAADRIRVGEADVMIAAGTESMSMVPMMGNSPSLSPTIFANPDDIESYGIAYGMGLLGLSPNMAAAEIALALALVTIGAMLGWEKWRPAALKLVPGALIGVVASTLLAFGLGLDVTRVVVPEDIAAAVLYLSSRAGQFVTGKLLEVDGGIQEPNLDLGLPDLVPGGLPSDTPS